MDAAPSPSNSPPRETDATLHVSISPATLRASGDAEVHVPAGARTVVLGPCEPLRSLMVEGGPDCEVLDVSALPEDVMLYTSGLPGLRRLLLPRGTGTHLHLALGAAPQLSVEGSISWVDACWPTPRGEATLHAAWNGDAYGLRPPILDGAWLGPAREAPANVDLVAVCGDDADTVDLRHHRAPCVVVEHCRELRTLRAGSPAVLMARSCPVLRDIHVEQVTEVQVLDAPRLQEVSGTGGAIHLRSSACVDTLHAHGDWVTLSVFYDGPRRIVAHGTRSLEATLAPRLERKACEFARGVPGEPVLVTSPEHHVRILVRRFLERRKVTSADKREFVRTMSRAGALRLLEALNEMATAERPLDLATLWELREMMTRSTRLRGGEAHAWRWNFPADLADRGWRADLQLWVLAREACDEARAFEMVLRNSSEPHNLATVASMVSEALAPHATRGVRKLGDLWLSILRDQLHAGLAQGQFQRFRRGRHAAADRRKGDVLDADPETVQALQRALRALARMRTSSVTPGLVQLFAAWCVARVPDASGVRILAAMHELGSREATRALADVIALEGVPPEIRHAALVASLVAPAHDVFAFSTEASHGS